MSALPFRAFADSNVVIYAASYEEEKASRAEQVLRTSIVSVQVLNETTRALRYKLKCSWRKIDAYLQSVRAFCPVVPLTIETHDLGRHIAERYQLQFFDALIAASALLAKCDTLYSEDMQHGLLLEEQLRVVNPFA
ncbi:MAG: PIN domain-containing protein [Zoogloeaceae bacterium]|jgi:predicted nucleic acid-binding protein|nr:PIN domain-containing protein [Zoogloeaceae bacterium]